MNTFKLILATILTVSITPLRVEAQPEDLQAVIHLDSVFWNHYNTCHVDAMRDFLTSDLEFYHDKGGPMSGLENFLKIAQQNLCSNNNFRLRREAVVGTIQIFPMKKGDMLYGAILTGQHVFYIIESGKERLDGFARFSHLWLKTEQGWRMSRVFSYDHGPAKRGD